MFGKQQDPSRTEEATPKRRNKQRQEGNVPKSQELGKAVSLTGGLIALHLWLGPMTEEIKTLFRRFLGHAWEFDPNPQNVYTLSIDLTVELCKIILPILLFLGFLAFLAQRLQVGKLWTTKVFKFKWQRFNIIKGLKQMMFSPQTALRTIKSLLFSIILALIPGYLIYQEYQNFLPMYYATPEGVAAYMLQMGLPIPVSDRSKAGLFDDIMMDIGDEQSLENDLSTYSSHLLSMKRMIRQANDRTLILIDEFGTGTEPQIGGAIAQAVLEQFWKRQAWAVITTHYQNLKHFAEDHPGVANGAMLYDRHEMRPLFQLAIGRPGSSFAIEIARKIGLPEEVIREASEIVGSDYIQSDKYLQDIVRDKRYWEAKRQTVHAREKELEKRLEKYESMVEDVEKSRKEILARARAQAEELIKESNKRIENTIREIREHQAEKEETRKIRQQLAEFERGLDKETPAPSKEKRAKGHGVMSDEDFQAKVERIRSRKERHEKRQAEKASQQKKQAEMRPTVQRELPIDKGDTVRIKGLTSTGTVESLDGKMAMVVFGGGMRTKMRLDRLERAQEPKASASTGSTKTSLANLQTYAPTSNITRSTVDAHVKHFRTEIDLRGMRGDEALMQVQYFIDDAILAGASQVRILHGKGNGILRQMIRQYLATVPNVRSFRDEHVQFGGAGITVVEL